MKRSSYIPLPDFIMRKKAIINIQNRDKKCFHWSVLRYLHPANRDEHRLTDLRQYENELNTKEIIFPVKLRDITKFQSLNPSLPGINVFSVNEHNKFYPLRMAQRDTQQTIDLFLYEQDGKYHYSLIKNFSRLFRSQITSRTNGTIYICKKCFTHFSKQELYDKHITYCSSNETVGPKYPICYDSYCLCDLSHEKKLETFSVAMLKDILKYFEIPFSSRDRKKKSCSEPIRIS